MVNSTAYGSPTTISYQNTTELVPDTPSCRSPVTSEDLIADGYSGTLLWSPEKVSLLLSGTFYGGLLTIWWSGYLADKFGPKTILLAAVANFAIFTFLTPTLANTNFFALFGARLIMGLGEVSEIKIYSFTFSMT